MPEVQVVSTLSTILKTLELSTNKAIEDYLFAVRVRAQEQLDRGVPPDEVYKSLLQDIKDNSGEFKDLTGALGSQIDKALGQTAMDTSNEFISGLSDRYEWVWEPGAQHCDTCEEYNGQIKSYDEWEKIGLPGAGNTDCTVYCRCTLMPVT